MGYGHQTCLQLPELPKIIHVKGHQDEKASFANLSLEAPLKIEAAEMATEET